jgi:hypothetical protein
VFVSLSQETNNADSITMQMLLQVYVVLMAFVFVCKLSFAVQSASGSSGQRTLVAYRKPAIAKREQRGLGGGGLLSTSNASYRS